MATKNCVKIGETESDTTANTIFFKDLKKRRNRVKCSVYVGLGAPRQCFTPIGWRRMRRCALLPLSLKAEAWGRGAELLYCPLYLTFISGVGKATPWATTYFLLQASTWHTRIFLFHNRSFIHDPPFPNSKIKYYYSI